MRKPSRKKTAARMTANRYSSRPMTYPAIREAAITIRERPNLRRPTDSRYLPASSLSLATFRMVRASSPRSENIMKTAAKEKAKLY